MRQREMYKMCPDMEEGIFSSLKTICCCLLHVDTLLPILAESSLKNKFSVLMGFKWLNKG